MNSPKILEELNISANCRKYNLSLWQCPQFLFLIMGIIIIVSNIVFYFIGSRYVEDPAVVVLVILFLTTFLLIISFVIIHDFERLAETNKMKSEFFNVVSHQLRSPLTNLIWGVDYLMSGSLGRIEEKQLEYFKILKDNSTRMSELIADLLTISRLESARFPLKKESFSLPEMTKELIAGFTPSLGASNINVKFNFGENPPNAIADSSQIRLVVENFLDNAIRYSRKGGEIQITVNGNKKEKNVYFEVKDSGVGIPGEDQKRIFQKFFRAGNVNREKTEGSGLGLYIAKAIIEKSKGKIGFESSENKGSIFWFTLPAR